ncbi:MAG: DUF2333 family protein [Desulfobacteraceae bacterium]|jgi:hypothetical protein
MVNPPENQISKKDAGFTGYAAMRTATAVALTLLVIWAFSSIPESFGQDKKSNHGSAGDLHKPVAATSGADEGDGDKHTPGRPTPQTDSHDQQAPQTDSHDRQAPQTDSHDRQAPQTDSHDQQAPHGVSPTAAHDDRPAGVSFVEATIAPLEYELNHRFWGWRPNDIINLTDNVNNFQLGVLEVTRRTVVLLAERISRTGTTDAFNTHLENSMNWLMVKADRYWFPAPETKYKESIKELEAYKEDLINGNGSFYTRTDNLIPLLSSYEDLLGSCDENLVKQKNHDGTNISMFKADDYFYYAQGVASAMASVLEAVHHDFLKTLESRHAAELLHHALESCRQAAALDPILITNGDLDGILANHRANMAAPISHARFFIGQLIKTLST